MTFTDIHGNVFQTTTDSNGLYSINLPSVTGGYRVEVQGGTDKLTGKSNTVILVNKIEDISYDVSTLNITALTTINTLAQENNVHEQDVISFLGVDKNKISSDMYASNDFRVLKVNQLAIIMLEQGVDFMNIMASNNTLESIIENNTSNLNTEIINKLKSILNSNSVVELFSNIENANLQNNVIDLQEYDYECTVTCTRLIRDSLTQEFEVEFSGDAPVVVPYISCQGAFTLPSSLMTQVNQYIFTFSTTIQNGSGMGDVLVDVNVPNYVTKINNNVFKVDNIPPLEPIVESGDNIIDNICRVPKPTFNVTRRTSLPTIHIYENTNEITELFDIEEMENNNFKFTYKEDQLQRRNILLSVVLRDAVGNESSSDLRFSILLDHSQSRFELKNRSTNDINNVYVENYVSVVYKSEPENLLDVLDLSGNAYDTSGDIVDLSGSSYLYDTEGTSSLSFNWFYGTDKISLGTEATIQVPSEAQNKMLYCSLVHEDLEGHIIEETLNFPNKVHWFNDSISSFELINLTTEENNVDRSLNTSNEFNVNTNGHKYVVGDTILLREIEEDTEVRDPERTEYNWFYLDHHQLKHDITNANKSSNRYTIEEDDDNQLQNKLLGVDVIYYDTEGEGHKHEIEYLLDRRVDWINDSSAKFSLQNNSTNNTFNLNVNDIIEAVVKEPDTEGINEADDIHYQWFMVVNGAKILLSNEQEKQLTIPNNVQGHKIGVEINYKDLEGNAEFHELQLLSKVNYFNDSIANIEYEKKMKISE